MLTRFANVDFGYLPNVNPDNICALYQNAYYHYTREQRIYFLRAYDKPYDQHIRIPITRVRLNSAVNTNNLVEAVINDGNAKVNGKIIGNKCFFIALAQGLNELLRPKDPITTASIMKESNLNIGGRMFDVLEHGSNLGNYLSKKNVHVRMYYSENYKNNAWMTSVYTNIIGDDSENCIRIVNFNNTHYEYLRRCRTLDEKDNLSTLEISSEETISPSEMLSVNKDMNAYGLLKDDLYYPSSLTAIAREQLQHAMRVSNARQLAEDEALARQLAEEEERPRIVRQVVNQEERPRIVRQVVNQQEERPMIVRQVVNQQEERPRIVRQVVNQGPRIVPQVRVVNQQERPRIVPQVRVVNQQERPRIVPQVRVVNQQEERCRRQEEERRRAQEQADNAELIRRLLQEDSLLKKQEEEDERLARLLQNEW